MKTIHCLQEEQTQRLGYCLGARLRPGDAVLLEGEMGAGKSVLTRAAARAMGVQGAVPSPTFTLVNIHEGTRMKLYHFDLYRLSGEDELYAAGLEEMIPPTDGACMIEWPQCAAGAMPEDALLVRIARDESGEGRQITLLPRGAFDAARVAQIVADWEAADAHTDD